MFSSNTFKDAAERAIAAVCQTFIALVGTDGAGVVSIDLLDAAQASLVAGVLSIVKSYAAVNVSRVPATPRATSKARW